MKKVELYSDGSCLGNPGPGGYGTVLVYKKTVKELSKGFKLTTNNRMELLGAIVGLEALTEACEVTVTTDSQYVRKGITEWLQGWKRKNWKTSGNKPVKNKDLWQRLDAINQKHQVQWHWVKGHSGHPMNERCDELARTAAEQSPVNDDVGFESP